MKETNIQSIFKPEIRFIDLETVEHQLKAGYFETRRTIVDFNWDEFKKATLQALRAQSVLNERICLEIVSYACLNSDDEDAEGFLKLVQDYEFILTELMNDGFIQQN